MPTFDGQENYSANNVLTFAHLAALVTSIETFLNTTKLDQDNIQSGGIATANLADACVTAAKIASAVAGDGLSGGAGTALSVSVDDVGIEISADTLQLKDSGVVTAKINDSAVTTDKLNDGAVTAAKKAALGQQVSSASGSISSTSDSYSDMNNLSVSITTTGRPVFVGLIPDGSSAGYIEVQNTNSGTTTANGLVQILRDSTSVGIFQFVDLCSSSSGSTHLGRFPGSLFTIDIPSSGTYTYKAQYKLGGGVAGDTILAGGLKLIAFEL